MTHTPHTTPSVEYITRMNDAIDKHVKHRHRQHITSQSYNSHEAYDTRRARAYVTELWRTHHTPIINAVRQHADKLTPRWQYEQEPPSHTPIPTRPPHTERTAILVIDATGQGEIYTGTLTVTDTDTTFRTQGHTLRVHRPTQSEWPSEVRTPYGTYTDDEVASAAISTLCSVYMLDEWV